jgi:hypothetical protein
LIEFSRFHGRCSLLVPFQLVRASLFDDACLSSGPAVGPTFGLSSWNGTRSSRHLLGGANDFWRSRNCLQ